MKEINIEITHDCALKCIFCSSSSEHPSPCGQLDSKDIKRILEDGKKCGASIFSISGGEPLLHKEIFEILEVASSLNYKVLLYTSGVIFDKNEKRIPVSEKIWKKIKGSCKDIKIIFNLQGATRNTVDKLMGVKGAFNLIIKSIKNAVSKELHCEAHFVPMRPNIKEFFDTITLANKLNLRKVSLLRFVPQGRGFENKDKLLLSHKEFLELQYAILRMEKEIEAKKSKTKIRLGIPIDFTFLVTNDKKIKTCRGAKDAPCILPNGDVYICPALKNIKHLKAGNIKSQSICDIWENSKIFTDFRNLLKNLSKFRGKCKKCTYFKFCQAKCPAQRILYYKGEIKYPKCLYLTPDPACPLVNGIKDCKK